MRDLAGLRQWPDSEQFNAEPRDYILAAEAEESSIERSNIGGWHSDNDFLQRGAAPINGCGERLQQMTMALTMATRHKMGGRHRVNRGSPRR